MLVLQNVVDSVLREISKGLPVSQALNQEKAPEAYDSDEKFLWWSELTTRVNNEILSRDKRSVLK